jgi:hypothetical protein
LAFFGPFSFGYFLFVMDVLTSFRAGHFFLEKPRKKSPVVPENSEKLSRNLFEMISKGYRD